MFAKIYHLRARFHDAHMAIEAKPQNIVAPNGEKVGCLDRIGFVAGALRAQGWVKACRNVTLASIYAERTAPVQNLSVDVAKELKTPPDVGFDVSQSLTFHQFTHDPTAVLKFASQSGETAISEINITFKNLWIARLKCDGKFLVQITKIFPLALRWLVSRRQSDRARILGQLAIGPLRIEPEFNNRIFSEAPISHNCESAISIVLPIYNALDLLPEALDRVKHHTKRAFHLTIVEDSSTDNRVRPFLRKWLAENFQGFPHTYLENDTNLGFIGSVNRGLANVLSDPAQLGPIVLLNSDAFVPDGWDLRLTLPFAEDINIASTTPMSNDAEIMSVPVQCTIRNLPKGAVDAIDATARRLNPLEARAVVPTGVGFCMAIARRWAEKFPELDTAFGRGYGEEVDWCQKVRKNGGYHLGLGNLFVEHRGGASFGSADKMAMIAKNNGIVSSRYPLYDSDVRDFIISDPLVSSRFTLALKWAETHAANAHIPVYLAHSLGGGAERYLLERLQNDIGRIGVGVVLRIGGLHRWRLEIHTSTGVTAAATQDSDTVMQLLNILSSRHFVYSCGVGDSDPIDLVETFLNLFDPETDELTVLVHDFFMISPSYTLLGADGTFKGPLTADLIGDSAHTFRRPNCETLTVLDWQKCWHSLLATATEVTVFSENSAEIISQVWPDLRGSIQVKPHRMPRSLRVFPLPQQDSPRILGVLGGINHAKGAAVLKNLAHARPDQKIVVIGQVDPAFKMPSNVQAHGHYRPEDIPKLAQKYGITLWLIPSIWPETFSYTTHEALATQLRVLAFDIGAQGEAVRNASNGEVVPIRWDRPLSTENLTASILDYLA